MSNRIDLNSWSDFEQAIEQLKSKNKSTKGLMPRLLYRGQSNASWPLKSTLERKQEKVRRFRDYVYTIAIIQPEIETLNQTSWDTPSYNEIENLFSHYEDFHISDTLYKMYGYMIYLRHHGFPSPLLDWSRSARIAAYFAFANELSEEKVSIHVLSEATMHSGGSHEPQIRSLGPRVKTHRRHYLQQCEYTMCGIFRDGEWWITDYEKAFEDHDDIDEAPVNFANYQITLPSSEKMKVLEILYNDNVNAYSLFGSDESLMETLSFREFHFSDPYFNKT